MRLSMTSPIIRSLSQGGCYGSNDLEIVALRASNEVAFTRRGASLVRMTENQEEK